MKKIVLCSLFLFVFVSCTALKGDIDSFFDDKKNESNPKLIALSAKNPLEVKIAVVVPLSGKYEFLGKNIMDALQLALYELRADNISLKAIDIGSDKTIPADVLTDTNFGDVDLILGPIFKEQAETIYKYARSKNLNMITYSNDISLMNKSGLYVFDFIPYQQIKKVVKYASDNNYSNIYSVVPNDIYGELVEKVLLNNRYKDHYHIKKVSAYSASNVTAVKRFTLSEAIFNIKSAAKDDLSNRLPGFGEPALLAPETGNNLLRVLNQMQFVHSSKDMHLKLLGIGDWSQYPIEQNILSNDAWISDIPHTQIYDFDNRFLENYKYRPSRLSAVAYDSAMLIAAILNKTDGGIVLEFQELERSSGYQGITGAFRLKSNGLNERLYSVYKYNKGRMHEVLKAENKF
ncbi:MAG: branched-chain amino acid transport system substrate-binding protein [Candidatus Midichloriaceae bacterium]|jgi:branched-chain amino acid transport system substrate-binding protein